MNVGPTRRRVLQQAATTAATCSLFGFRWTRPALAQVPSWSKADPFSLGVASGAPAPDGFVIWTRLAPEPLSANPSAPGGMPPIAVPVVYEVAEDAKMASIVRRGTAVAQPALAHALHIEIGGLQPGRPYWYRFASGDAVSRIGRAMTLPTPDSHVDRIRFGYVSCSNYEHGYFSAYRHLADDNPDFTLFLGDYIYEYVDHRPGTVRRHSDGVEATDLRTYRNRYAQYHLDPDLQRLHAEVPSLITWDDHEVQNDYADQWSQTFDDPAAFLRRRAAAYQAFYEHMPLRPRCRPKGPAMALFDRFRFGALAEISVLDGRQYRSREACYGRPNHGGGHLETAEGCPELLDATRSMIGQTQEAWLYDGLAQSQSRWNVIAQDVLMARFRQKTPDGSFGYWTDDWDGCPVGRTRLMRRLQEARIANPVVLSGDIHSFWANDLLLDFDNPKSGIVGTEFVGTSISAHGPEYDRFARSLADNPHVRFFESRVRGYAVVDIRPGAMTTSFRAISDPTKPDATVSTLKTFVVEDGRPGAVSA